VFDGTRPNLEQVFYTLMRGSDRRRRTCVHQSAGGLAVIIVWIGGVALWANRSSDGPTRQLFINHVYARMADGSDVVFDRLRDDLPWRAMERPMYDRIVPVPRLICTVDIGSLGDTHPLRTITHALEKGLQARFSSVGVNYYRTGQDSVAWHRDGSYKTQRPSTVALVSLGSPRTLAVRAHAQYCSKTAETTGITPVTRRRWRLGHGDLLVMQGRCQRDWEHCVPKERAVGPRISLAFRS